jgi:hypothetical protein
VASVVVLAVSTAISVIGVRGHSKAQAQVAPSAARQPGLEPAPAQQLGRYEIMWTSVAYYFFTQDGRAVLQFPGRPVLTYEAGRESEGIRAFSQRPPNLMLPQGIGRNPRYFVDLGAILYWENKADGAIVHFLNCPSIELTGEETAHLRDLANQFLTSVLNGPDGPQQAPPTEDRRHVVPGVRPGISTVPPEAVPPRRRRPGDSDDEPGISPVPPGAVPPPGGGP